MVVNASNREKIVAWLNNHAAGTGVSLADNTISTAMIAVQGPKAIGLMQPHVELPAPLTGMRYYTYAIGKFDGNDVLISRTGYTGEDGVEIVCAAARGAEVWERIIADASKVGGLAAGLGARDTLRLEAAMPLYGHELSESITPLEAGLNIAVTLGGREYVGSKALEKAAADKSQPVRVGLQLDGKRVPRQGAQVLQGDEVVGEVTSGTFSPTFECPIAMAYVRPTAAAIGTHLATDIRGKKHAAVVVPLPFYERSKKN
jgi:aminomethyltransferase